MGLYVNLPPADVPLKIARAKSLFIGAFAAGAVAIGGYWVVESDPVTTGEIFRGIAFFSEVLSPSAEGAGKLYVAVADLNSPGTQLYVTPLDPSALEEGWHYRLRRISDVAEKEHLSVVVNATMFGSRSPYWFRMPGDLANSAFGTVVADHVVADVQDHSDVLWFDDQLTPFLRPWDPSLQAKDLADAKWAVGGRIILRNGQQLDTSQARDSRTVVAVDQQRRLLLAVGTDISPRLLAEKLATRGAKYALMLDGGTSSAMAIGGNANGVKPGVVWGGWRPVATYFGIRAQPIGRGAISK